MKKSILTVVLYVVFTVVSAQAEVLVYLPNGTYVTKPTLSAAAADEDCTGKKIVVTSPLTIKNDLVWPADRELDVSPGGKLTFSSGKKLTFAPGGKTLAVRPEWWGAKADNSTDCIVGLQAAVNSGLPVHLGVGTYNYTPPLLINLTNVHLIGVSKSLTRLAVNNVAADGIIVGEAANVDEIYLSKFRLTGRNTSGNGIVLGKNGFHATQVHLKQLYIENFTKTDSSGLIFNRCWWFSAETCSWEGNYINIRVPNKAVTTTLLFYNNCTIRNALTVGVLCDGGITSTDSMTFRDTSFEYNNNEAFKSVGNKGKYVFDGSYFEVNSTRGPGTITVIGNSAAYSQSSVEITNCYWHQTTIGYGVYLENCKSSRIVRNKGLLQSGSISTAATVQLYLEGNNMNAAADPQVDYHKLLGNIEAFDIYPADGNWYKYSSTLNGFHGHLGSYQIKSPTITVLPAAGSLATVSLTGATDTKGLINITTGKSHTSGRQVKITFNSRYRYSAPTVMITPYNSAAAAIMDSAGIIAEGISATEFYIYFTHTANDSIAYKFNYFVIQ